jgi:membrane-associated phospholipid phosphatase
MSTVTIPSLQSAKLYFALSFFWIAICGALITWVGDSHSVILINGLHTHRRDLLFSVLTGYAEWVSLVFIVGGCLCIAALRTKHFVITVLVTLATLMIVVHSAKSIIGSDRPLNVIPDLYRVPWLPQAFEHGMPSGHTTTAFAISTLLLRSFPMPQFMQLILFVFAAGCGLSRIYLAQHFTSDVLVGTLLGLCLGEFIARLSKKYW